MKTYTEDCQENYMRERGGYHEDRDNAQAQANEAFGTKSKMCHHTYQLRILQKITLFSVYYVYGIFDSFTLFYCSNQIGYLLQTTGLLL